MKSIQKKFSLFITALIFATAVIITVLAIFIFNSKMTNQMQEDTGALSTSYSLAVRNQIEGFKMQLKQAAVLEGITQSDTKERDALLQQLAKSSGFQYFAISDSSGKTSRNSDISKREYFQKAIAGETYMSSPLINAVDGTVTIMVATPIDNGTGYKGVLYGGLLYDTFSKVISNIKVGDGGYAYIIDKSGIVVAHPDTGLVEKMTNFTEMNDKSKISKSTADTAAKMIKGETGTAYVDEEGAKRLYAYTPLEGPEKWSISVSVPMTQITNSINQMIYIIVVAVAVLIVLCIIIALLFARAISKPITAVTKRIELLAEGNLGAPVTKAKGRDEVARLTAALQTTVEGLQSYIRDIDATLNAMSNNDFTVSSSVDYKGDFIQIKKSVTSISDSMSNVLGMINSAAEQVSSGSNLVSKSSMELSQGATQQASAVQELSASLEEIASQTAKNVGNAQSANRLAQSARSNAENGNYKMADMLSAMDEISESSSNINKIIKVIDDIAFQTNILALNAAVEAARAGQHGKGFAVVAEEVRTLASRSAQAAKETTTLIEGTIKKVEMGSAIADETAKALTEIVEEIAKAADLVESITRASDEQAIAVEQIKQGIQQVSNVVQNNAATSEESAAASEELSSQAAHLKETVSAFKLKNTHK